MYGKILLKCKIVVRTGLHIGGSNAFSAIGAADKLVVRDPLSGLPIIPGSSLKGKLRTLIARSICGDITKMPNWNDDAPQVGRLFGIAQTVPSRLQFADCFVTNAEQMRRVGITEVKAENSIDRSTSVANPRFIERVTPGTEFAASIVYDITQESEIMEDLQLLAKGMKLLQLDYLGGNGTRGSGRVSLRDFEIEVFGADLDQDVIRALFDEVHSYELLPV